MSNVQEEAVAQIVLNDQQVNAIIEFASLPTSKMYPTAPPEDADLRRRDAATLVYQARRAAQNGNTDARVVQICALAGDQAEAPAQPVQVSSTQEVSTETPSPVMEQHASGFEPPAQNGAVEYTEEQLSSMIEALRPNAAVPAIKAELDKLEAQLQQRRSGAPAQPQVPQVQVPPPAPQGAPASAPGTVAEQPPAPPLPPAPGAPAQPAVAGPPPLPVAPDVGPAPVPQAPQPDAQGQPPAAAADAEAQRRAALEAQVTGGMLVAYGKTFADVAGISTEDLERMVVNPGGPVAAETTPTAPPAPPPPSPVSSEREGLIEQISGPMIKAWRRGRVDLPKLSDDELREMIAYPGGPTTRPQGEGFLENDSVAGVPTPPAQAAPQQPEAPAFSPQPPAAPAAQQAPLPGVVVERMAPWPLPSSADAIIAREKFPIPPEVESPPALPFDISKLSDEQLRSVYAQFGAVLSRVNWVIAEHKDEIFGLKRALNTRKVEVRGDLPKSADGKKLTNDDKDSLVAADPQVVQIEAQIAEKERPLIKLETIAEGARSSCARASREASMRFGEERPVHRGDR